MPRLLRARQPRAHTRRGAACFPNLTGSFDEPPCDICGGGADEDGARLSPRDERKDDESDDERDGVEEQKRGDGADDEEEQLEEGKSDDRSGGGGGSDEETKDGERSLNSRDDESVGSGSRGRSRSSKKGGKAEKRGKGKEKDGEGGEDEGADTGDDTTASTPAKKKGIRGTFLAAAASTRFRSKSPTKGKKGDKEKDADGNEADGAAGEEEDGQSDKTPAKKGGLRAKSPSMFGRRSAKKGKGGDGEKDKGKDKEDEEGGAETDGDEGDEATEETPKGKAEGKGGLRSRSPSLFGSRGKKGDKEGTPKGKDKQKGKKGGEDDEEGEEGSASVASGEPDLFFFTRRLTVSELPPPDMKGSTRRVFMRLRIPGTDAVSVTRTIPMPHGGRLRAHIPTHALTLNIARSHTMLPHCRIATWPHCTTLPHST